MSRLPPGGGLPGAPSEKDPRYAYGRSPQPPPQSRPMRDPYAQGDPRPSSNRPPPPAGNQYSSAQRNRLALTVDDQKGIETKYLESYHRSNVAAVNGQDWGLSSERETTFIKINNRGREYVVTVRSFPMVPPGCIWFGEPHRMTLGVALNDKVDAESFNPIELGQKGYLGSVDVSVTFASVRSMPNTPYRHQDLQALFTNKFNGQILAPGQQLILRIDNEQVPVRCIVKGVTLVDQANTSSKAGQANALLDPTDENPLARGLLGDHTQVFLQKGTPPTDKMIPINITGAPRRGGNAVVRPDFNFSSLGIGGLDDEFTTVFRRAFASRIFPPSVIDQLGLLHVKGILLYGPPGTGKTLIARQIGKMLQAREPKVINGPEVLNKFVGQSEENIRKLFADAEKEYKEKGDDSELHVIIFDELDAVCKQRGSGAGGGTGVGDSVVNQLLSKLDGVDQLNNILLIGMTNRKDMIDDALLRPGRLEVQVEISLPDEKGRQQILAIHTKKMKENGRLAGDVDLAELAGLTKNFSGAEINGLCKSAASFAFQRHTKAGTMAGISSDAADLVITREDFMGALSEVTPAFGVSEDELTRAIIYGIIPFSNNIQRIIQSCMIYIDGLRSETTRSPNVSLLFHGPSGSGKTSLAAHIAQMSQFPFVKVISPELLVSYRSENAKSDQIHKYFTDAFKSPLSILIVDDIEGLIEWNPVGPRMSNLVLQTLRALLRTVPPKNHRLLVMGTTSRRSVLQQLDFTDTVFDKEIAVPSLGGLNELERVLHEQQTFRDGSSMVEAMNLVAEATQGSNQVNVGIKNILKVAESAKALDEDTKAAWFAEEMQVLMSRGF
ncbi:vesicular-fusion protein SEC18 [Diaporthe helianthi]|uniref:Vesicular-fusion protein SEC18 n=1 Tax=Diaporthe helianthi TaxID=158607 RepID=A0A2P5HSX5_DIAHE|nr:vesicular-fusion protein SEC18 [Diaporthe helianthi]